VGQAGGTDRQRRRTLNVTSGARRAHPDGDHPGGAL